MCGCCFTQSEVLAMLIATAEFMEMSVGQSAGQSFRQLP